jgi:hypothetical protein
MQVWQVAAGDGSRDYSDIFLKFGVILMGPGSEGSYFENIGAYTNPESWVYRPFLKPLAESVSKDDLVILKKPSGGRWEVLAVGKVVSEYIHCETFSDVDGWDLQHCRKVEWKTPTSTTIIDGLRRGTFFGVNKEEPINEANRIWSSGLPVISELIPPTEPEITVDELIDSIMVFGLSATTAGVIADTIWKLRRIATWYSGHGSGVGEHEIRTFLIVPLLISLGWSEQKIKIEWNNIDVAVFNKPYSENQKPILLIESKRLWDGLLYAPSQAAQYAKQFTSCKLFIVSDGIRYKLYELEADNWKYTAYMNLSSPKRNHPYLCDVRGAVDFFLKILPQ